MCICCNIIFLFTDVEIKREGDKIHRVFQDPTGQHLLVCMESKECYYIGSRLPKRSQPKPLQKVKGQLIESVAWNKVDQSEHSTGAILLGTSTGERYCACTSDVAIECLSVCVQAPSLRQTLYLRRVS
jgi:hypothetical protein